MNRQLWIITIICGIISGSIIFIVSFILEGFFSAGGDLGLIAMWLIHFILLAIALLIARGREDIFPFLTVMTMSWLTSIITIITVVACLAMMFELELENAFLMFALYSVLLLVPSALMGLFFRREKKKKSGGTGALDDPGF